MIAFGGEEDDAYRFSRMMWADNCWTLSHDKFKLAWIVNDSIEELTHLDMEPKRESLWWTSTHNDEDERTLKVGSSGKKLGFTVC